MLYIRNPILSEDIDSLCKRLQPVCKALVGRQIFLTGGTGFFGKWLLHCFLKIRQAYDIDVSLTVLSRDPRRFLNFNPEFSRQDGLVFIEGDVRSFNLANYHYDFVIHAATTASAKLDQNNPDEMDSVIIEGTRHILEFTQQCSAARLLYISSGAVYGPQPPTLSHLPETYEGVPTTAYGKGKKVAEQMCLEASEGRFECVIARPFAFVGPYLPLDTHFAIGNFIRNCLNNEPITITGDGTPLRSYLYASDLVEWLWTILLNGKSGRAYNVGSDEALSICDLAHLVRKIAGTKNDIIVCEKAGEGAMPKRYVPSIDRVKTELALSQRVSLSDAIRRTIAGLDSL